MNLPSRISIVLPTLLLAFSAVAAELVCGVASEIPGFTARDAAGRYQGFEVEFCRAVAAARYGSPEAVQFVGVPNLEVFEREPGVDLVVGGLTAAAARETDGRVRFGPVYFQDGQHFVVRSARALAGIRSLAGQSICVSTGTRAAATLQRAFVERDYVLNARLFETDALAWQAFERGECEVYSADLVEIVKGLAAVAKPADYAVLPERISEEPLAPLLHAGDHELMRTVNETLRAIVDAEAAGAAARKSTADYGAIYDRTLGDRSRFRIPRAGNRLVRDGGLIAAPPPD